ncbi:MAG: Lrp/AsnC family transcriptional regulator [Clostridia bacterium]|nr:Lrp/AsnC family transcriptional regulator [Clostridia bacterium]
MVRLDDIDIRILGLLKENARIKASQISQIVGLSVSSVTERIRKLEQSGVITAYTAVIDQKKLGNTVTALMEVSLDHPKFYDAFAKMVEETACVVSCYYISGDFDFMLKVLAPSEELEEIHRTIKSFPGVSGTRTNVVLKSLKTGTTLLPDPAKFA